MVDSSSLLALDRCCAPSCWPPCFRWETCYPLNCCSSIGTTLFLSFQKLFFWFLVFRGLPFVLVQISLDLSLLGFAQLLKSVDLYLLPNLGNFQPLFPQISFHTALSLLLFSDSDEMNVSFIDIIPWVPEALFIFSSLFFSLLFRFGNFYWSVFKNTDYFLCCLQSTIKHVKNFISVTVFSSSIISLGFFF